MEKSFNFKFFLVEFLMVFLGVFIAFWINNWGERSRDREFVRNIMGNIIQDVRDDSVMIVAAITRLQQQFDSLTVMVALVESKQYPMANRHIYWCYFSDNTFSPSTETFSSMIFGGDMKLVENPEVIRALKDLNNMNRILEQVHGKYYNSIGSFRNEFVCKGDMDRFNFKQNEYEFWNRLNFLRVDVKLYLESLTTAQLKYNDFLATIKIN